MRGAAALKKRHWTLESVKPVLLHIFAWINLLNGHNLCPEKQPCANCLEGEWRNYSVEPGGWNRQLPEKHLKFLTVAQYWYWQWNVA